MKDRNKQVAIVAGVLFLIAAIGGLLGSGAFKSASAQWKTGYVVFLLIAVVMLAATYWWALRYPLARVVPDVLLSVAIACVVSILLVPLIESTTAKGKWHGSLANPFAGGAGIFFDKIWFFLGCGLAGAAAGWLIAVALGQDYRAKGLKRYAQTVSAKPRRVVRR